MTAPPRPPPDEDRPVEFRVARVLRRALSILLRSFVPFTIISAAATALPFVLIWVDPNPVRSVARVVPVALVDMVFRGIGAAMIVHATVQALNGRRPRLGPSVARGLRRIGPVVLTVTLVAVTVTIGFFLVLIPGFIASIAMFVAIPACVMERLGPIESITRSAALTRGARWRIFAVYSAIVGVGILVNRLIDALTPGAPSWLYPSLSFGWFTLDNAYEMVLVAVVYYELRVVKEGIDLDPIAAAFD